MENADKIVGALRCCGNTDTKKPDCEHCPLQSTRMCVKVMLEGAADLIVRLNDFDQTQSKIALERCQKAEAQLAISQRETQAAVEAGNRMAKAFALLCRMLDDFAGLPPCHIRQIDWPECNGESEQCGDRPIWQCWKKYILEQVDAEPVCRVCGCTEDNACPGGCYWVEPDLCSACAQAGEGGQDA